MRLSFPSQAEAQSYADSLHTWLIANNPDYAHSVAAGHTTAWAKPYQDLDSKGVPLTPDWFINVKERCQPALSPTDCMKLLPFKVK